MSQYRSPVELYGELFEEVQKVSHQDSICFVDAIPKQSPSIIRFLYKTEGDPKNVMKFVKLHFKCGIHCAPSLVPHASSVLEFIQLQWPRLERYQPIDDQGSLIALPKPYIVPGGRFNSMFYWDSFFTMLGLGKEMQLHIITNMVFLIELFGYVPNGNRTYFLGRSQPPLLYHMMKLIEPPPPQETRQLWQRVLEKELQFWLQVGEHGVFIRKGVVFSRYWDLNASDGPRPEGWKEDENTARLAGKTKATWQRTWQNIRASCESGWDFSSRWWCSSTRKFPLVTTSLLPVDLNAILLERRLAEGEDGKNQLRVAFDELFWNAKKGFYFDYDFQRKRQRDQVWTLAGIWPLYCGLASQEQADQVATHIKLKFLQPGGLITTLHYNTKEQWDAPNGWAPLQWVAIVGLKRYGFMALAETIRLRWLKTVDLGFQRTGRVMEKYNVVDITGIPADGEYDTVQDGFGWTNGVYAALHS